VKGEADRLTWLELGDRKQCNVDSSDNEAALPSNLQHRTEIT